MLLQDLLLMLQQAGILVNQLMALVAPAVALVLGPAFIPGCSSLATLKVGELTQMLVSGGGNVGSGASGRAMQTAAVARGAVTGRL